MNREELEEKIENLSKEIRSCADDYLNPELKVEEVEARSNQLKSELAQAKKELAQMEMPVENKEEVRTVLFDKEEWRKLAKGEVRSLTIGNTGAINQVKDLVKKVADNDDILNKCSFYYGPNASTNIPVLTPIADPSDYAEGASDVTVDSAAGVAVTEIQPKAYAAVLGISAENIAMGTVNLEAELPEIFGKAFRKVMHNGVLQGLGTSKKMTGIFVSAATADSGATVTSLDSGATSIKIKELATLALTVGAKDETYEIVMNPAVYTNILADSTSGEDVKVYKEGLIRDKSIEGVKIRLDGQCPSATTAGSILAVACPLNRYCIGVAGEMNITPIKVKGDTNTYFQAEMFFSGKQVSASDLYAIAVHA